MNLSTATVEEFNAATGHAVVVNPQTGEVECWRCMSGWIGGLFPPKCRETPLCCDHGVSLEFDCDKCREDSAVDAAAPVRLTTTDFICAILMPQAIGFESETQEWSQPCP